MTFKLRTPVTFVVPETGGRRSGVVVGRTFSSEPHYDIAVSDGSIYSNIPAGAVTLKEEEEHDRPHSTNLTE